MVYLVLEYCKGGDLGDFMSSIDPAMASMALLFFPRAKMPKDSNISDLHFFLSKGNKALKKVASESK